MSADVYVPGLGNYQATYKPRIIPLVTADVYATITAAGYLNSVTNQKILAGDLINAYYGAGVNGLFTVSIDSDGVVTMAPLSGAGEVSFTGPASTANALAVFSDTLGNIKAQSEASTLGFGLTISTGNFAVSAGTITGSGAIQSLTGNMTAGSSANPASFISFPASAGNGTFIFSALNAGGAFNTTLRNSVMGQSSVISLPDPGAATALVLLSALTGAGTQHITSGGLQIDGGTLITGLAAGGTAGSFTMYPATTANGFFKFSAVNAGGAFNTEVRNSVMGQSSVISIPDPGAATANFLLDTGTANILAKQEVIGIAGVMNFGTGTWTTTRVAQGNYVKRHTPGDETSIIAIDITPQLRVAASKGFRLDSFDVMYAIAANALDAQSVVLDRIVYANNVAVSVTSVPVTGTLATATQANPYVTNIAIDTPAFIITADSKYVVELTVNNAAASEYDYYGLNLRFSETIG
jgi:hypothetical protein